MREVEFDDIVKSIKTMIVHTAYNLPKDAMDALNKAYDEEKSPVCKEVLKQILENAEIARTEDRPLCQDTGLAVFFVKVGEDFRVKGGSLKDAINKGTEIGYKEGYLRASTCDCFTRDNLKDKVGYNLPGTGKTRNFKICKRSYQQCRTKSLSPYNRWYRYRWYI